MNYNLNHVIKQNKKVLGHCCVSADGRAWLTRHPLPSRSRRGLLRQRRLSSISERCGMHMRKFGRAPIRSVDRAPDTHDWPWWCDRADLIPELVVGASTNRTYYGRAPWVRTNLTLSNDILCVLFVNDDAPQPPAVAVSMCAPSADQCVARAKKVDLLIAASETRLKALSSPLPNTKNIRKKIRREQLRIRRLREHLRRLQKS